MSGTGGGESAQVQEGRGRVSGSEWSGRHGTRVEGDWEWSGRQCVRGRVSGSEWRGDNVREGG